MLQNQPMQLPRNLGNTMLSKDRPPIPFTNEEIVRRRAEYLQDCIAKNELRLPSLFQDKTLSNYEGMESSITFIKESLAVKKGFFATGQCGRGKTHLAIGAMYEYYAAGFKPLWAGGQWELGQTRDKPILITSSKFLFEIKCSYGKEGSDTKELFDYYANLKMLVIDDFGSEKTSDWTIETLDILIDERYKNERLTVITSNFTLGELADKNGDRMSSRFVGMGGIIKLDGPDWRLKK